MAAFDIRRPAVPSQRLQRLPLTQGGGTPVARLWLRLWNFLSISGSGADRFSMHLGAGQMLRLHDAAGWTVACRSGSVWITQEADSRDVFLYASDNFTLDRDGLALLLARQDSALAIRPPAGRKPQTAAGRPGSDPVSTASAREVWLRAVYPECGPWNDPAAYRRSGLL
ncbi:MAG: DUF2917 domain-containing protein [Burkholderiales bacterium]